jgi:hypothetical protein
MPRTLPRGGTNGQVTTRKAAPRTLPQGGTTGQPTSQPTTAPRTLPQGGTTERVAASPLRRGTRTNHQPAHFQVMARIDES